MSLRASFGTGAAGDVARAHVVRHEVARLHVQIFEEERPPAGDRLAPARESRSAATFSGPPRTE